MAADFGQNKPESGRMSISIPVSAVVYKGAAVPLMRKIPEKEDAPDCGKKGSGNTEERKELMKTDKLRFISFLLFLGSVDISKVGWVERSGTH